MKWHYGAALALPALLASAGVQASCGSAFCSVNTSWDLHSGFAGPGASLDLRYESITQDQPRSGSDKVGVGQIPRHHDEVSTKNRNWLGTFDYAFSSDWGVNVSAPLVDREHLHIHNHHGEQLPESWDFSALGDARVLGRYRLSSQEAPDASQLGATGLNFGLKLPTGDYKQRNAEGELAERTLQPGTVTTDALLGAYLVRTLPLKDLSWFAQAQFQIPLNARDGYKPGRRLTADAGLRYDVNDRVSLLLQANLLVRGKDSGVNAEPEDSGGRSLFLSPGVSAAVAKDVRVYGFLQLPLYQYVNGVQLTADRAGVVGVSARF
jgi:hypothetical protein